jgi:hypothetical protein
MKDIFASLKESGVYRVGGHEISLPIKYRRLDTFFALYGADRRAVTAWLPSPRLRPVAVWPGRVGVTLNAFNYLDTDIGPYGEFSLAVPCTTRRRGRLLTGVYIHRLPVTSDIALLAGKELWGYPKFLCQMEFHNSALIHQVRLSKDGQLILHLSLARGGMALDLARSLNTFTVKDGNLILTRILFSGLVRVNPHGLARLQTGPHDMGEEISRIELGPRALATGEFLDLKLALPEGENLGPV